MSVRAERWWSKKPQEYVSPHRQQLHWKNLYNVTSGNLEPTEGLKLPRKCWMVVCG